MCAARATGVAPKNPIAAALPFARPRHISRSSAESVRYATMSGTRLAWVAVFQTATTRPAAVSAVVLLSKVNASAAPNPAAGVPVLLCPTVAMDLTTFVSVLLSSRINADDRN